MSTIAPLATGAFRFRSASRTHVGLVRSVNEDRVLDCPDECIWAVADGMGGHNAGDVAADLVVSLLAGISPSASGYLRLAQLVQQIELANAELFGRSSQNTSAGRCGATLVAMLAHEEHYACIWVGDSRAYLYRDGSLARITRDHSLVQQLIDQKMLAEHERLAHPQSNIVTRAIGACAHIETEQRFAPFGSGDIFLLCSDGLTACLGDDTIADILRQPDLDRAADALLWAALGSGAPDNVSFIIVRTL